MNLDLARIRGLVLDLDGTLVDTFEDLREAVNRVRETRNLPPLDLPTVIAHVGQGARNLVQQTTAPSSEALLQENLQRFLAYYQERSLVRTRPYPGVPEALGRCSALGLALAVLTNKPEAAARSILAGLDLAPFFPVVQGGDSGSVMKPDPEVLRSLLARMGIAPSETLMVGDSDVDILTANRAGVAAVRVQTGQWRWSRLAPDLEVARLLDLASRLEAARGPTGAHDQDMKACITPRTGEARDPAAPAGDTHLDLDADSGTS